MCGICVDLTWKVQQWFWEYWEYQIYTILPDPAMYLPHRTVALHACEQIQMISVISAALWFCTTTVLWFTQDHDPPSHTLAFKCYHHLIIWFKTYRLWFCWDLSLFPLSIGQCFHDILVLTFTLSSFAQCHDVILFGYSFSRSQLSRPVRPCAGAMMVGITLPSMALSWWKSAWLCRLHECMFTQLSFGQLKSIWQSIVQI